MRLWRLSTRQHADAFDGGYGTHFNGRWNTIGHAVTYCATSPSLCVLEKLVHVEDPMLLPPLVMLSYDVALTAAIESVSMADLPADWRRREDWTQRRGDAWHRSRSTLLLKVPSAVVPIRDSPDLNVLINHDHSGVAGINVVSAESFVFDPRLL